MQNRLDSSGMASSLCGFCSFCGYTVLIVDLLAIRTDSESVRNDER